MLTDPRPCGSGLAVIAVAPGDEGEIVQPLGLVIRRGVPARVSCVACAGWVMKATTEATRMQP